MESYYVQHTDETSLIETNNDVVRGSKEGIDLPIHLTISCIVENS